MTQQEEYVRARWQFVGVWVRDLDSYGTDQFNVILCFPQEDADYNQEYFMRWQEDNDPKGRAAAWQAAYDFTVAREEEIRQLDEEICQMDDLSQMKRQDIDCEIDTAEGYDPSWNDNALVVYVRDLCEYSRTLARLQQALEDLEKGMVKP
jgi:hypothetical protein